ncbi:hypothetical protein EPO44_14740 [bacterium]|nr:MAG: hypothetical protein EPO44_14740 [bacterium]
MGGASPPLSISVISAQATTFQKSSIEEQWKGPRTSTITIEQPGGSVGAITQHVTGLAHFTVGEEIIIFLSKQEDSSLATVGGKQGKFLLKTDPQNKKEVIEDVTGKSQDLSDFVRRVRTTLANNP